MTTLALRGMIAARSLSKERLASTFTDVETHDLIHMVSFLVEIECGDSPRYAPPGSAARLAYDAGIMLIESELARLRCDARPVDTVPSLRAIAVIAASRACWMVLQDNEAHSARFRRQIRYILGFTPGYLLWYCSDAYGASRSPIGWIGGRSSWRDERRPVSGVCGAVSPERLKHNIVTALPRFDDVRTVVLHLVDQCGMPLRVEDIVSALLEASGTIEPEADLCRLS